MKTSVWFLLPFPIAVSALLTACLDEDTDFQLTLGPPPAHMERYGGDMDVHKAKIKLNLKPDSAYDAKHKAGIKTSFASDVDVFDQSSSVEMKGKIQDGEGFGAQATKSVWPTKINKKGNRMKWVQRKYGFGTRSEHHHGGNPITKLIALNYVRGKGRTYLVFKVTPKNKGNNDSDWMQYYSMLQDAFGEGKVSDSATGEVELKLNGYSTRKRALMTETHTLTGPIGLYGKNGKFILGEVKD